MYEELIIHLDRVEARASKPPKGLSRPLNGTSSIHCELEKVKFLKLFGAPKIVATKAWFENMDIGFSLSDYTSKMKVFMVVFQYKGSPLLWWKMLLP
jgi:hypothetical protein